MEKSQFEVFENEGLLRSSLIPTWIKIFNWIFFLFSFLGFLSLLTFSSDLLCIIDFYGINYNNNLYLGIISIFVIIFNGVVAYFLITKEDKAVELAKINALINIAICIITTVLNLYFYNKFTLRIEIFFIWFFYAKMREIQYKWINASKN